MILCCLATQSCNAVFYCARGSKSAADLRLLLSEQTKKLVQQGGCLVIKLDSMSAEASGRDYIQAEDVGAIRDVLHAGSL